MKWILLSLFVLLGCWLPVGFGLTPYHFWQYPRGDRPSVATMVTPDRAFFGVRIGERHFSIGISKDVEWYWRRHQGDVVIYSVGIVRGALYPALQPS